MVMKHLAGILALGLLGFALTVMNTPQMDEFTHQVTATVRYLERMGQ